MQRAANNRRMRHLDKFKRCPSCADKELPCSKPKFRIKDVKDQPGFNTVELSWYSAPTGHVFMPYQIVKSKEHGFTMPTDLALRWAHRWVTHWDELHVPVIADDYVI